MDDSSFPSFQAPERKCAICGVEKSDQQKLLKCSGCFSVRYCSVQHQKEHWKTHKSLCKEIAARTENSRRSALLNEAWDMALDCMKADDLEGFRKVLDDNDEGLVNWRPEEYEWVTLLLFSASIGKESYVSALLDRGADIHAKDDGGVTSLMHASVNGHASCISLLLDRGADIHAKDNDVVTSLMVASVNGHAACVSLLLDRGADIHAKDNDGWTSLMLSLIHI